MLQLQKGTLFICLPLHTVGNKPLQSRFGTQKPPKCKTQETGNQIDSKIGFPKVH